MSANVQRTERQEVSPGSSLKSLGLAFVVVMMASTVIFFILSKFGVQNQIAEPLSGSLFAAITYVSQLLDKGRSGRGPGLLPTGVVDFSGFAIPAYLMFAYFVIIMIAIIELSGGFDGMIISIFGLDLASAMPILLSSSFLVNIGGAFILGQWVGRRTTTRPFLLILAGCAVASTVGHGLDFVVLAPDDYNNVFGHEKSTSYAMFQMGGGFVLFSIPALIGCWRGRANKMSAYLNYLMKRIPSATRETMVNIAYEEASRLSSR